MIKNVNNNRGEINVPCIFLAKTSTEINDDINDDDISVVIIIKHHL